MEEQFILRVPPSVVECVDRLLDESASHEKSLDLSFSDDGRNDTFVIGDDHFPASLLDLPGIAESYKTYDDSVLIKTADVGQVMSKGDMVTRNEENVDAQRSKSPEEVVNINGTGEEIRRIHWKN
ncbi:putative TAFII55 protein region [Helianthus annuus]|nr:putative TAFII55 protein region [Helianthus annuus]